MTVKPKKTKVTNGAEELWLRPGKVIELRASVEGDLWLLAEEETGAESR